MKHVERWMISHAPRLTCAMYAFKHSKDSNYVSRVLNTDSLIMKCYEYGKNNPDKDLYFINLDSSVAGFFGLQNILLRYLAFADRFSFVPVIQYGPNNLYAEAEAINGSTNTYEYYYLQPGAISAEEAMASRNVIRAEYVHTQMPEIQNMMNNQYSVSEQYIQYMSRLYRKYISYNKTTEDYIECQLKGLSIDDKTIGVHYRGTDFKLGLRDHPLQVTLDEHIDSVKSLMDSGEYDRIFLATDDEAGIKRFREEFGDKVLFFSDTYRASDSVSVAYSLNERAHHKYKLGLEVIRDMEALSLCGALVAGMSQVVLSARINRIVKFGPYRQQIILDHGVTETGGDSSKELLKTRRKLQKG